MIIICEPQCVGFEHSEFNAALITITKYAFANENIMFLAEKEHLSLVKKILNSKSIEVGYMEIKVPPRSLIAPLLFPFELILVKKVFKMASNAKSNRIIFSSIRRPSLVAVKLLIRIFTNINCIIVLHNIIEAVTKKPYELTEIPFWFRFWIAFANMSRLSYLALGPSIEIELLKILPKLKNYVSSIDFPYFFQSNNRKVSSPNKVIKFGFFGVANRRKGAEDFFKMAKEITDQRTKNKPEFILIGPVEDKKLIKTGVSSVFVPSPNQPLSSYDFEKYAEDLDYAIIFHKEDQHRLTATASFFDAVSYLKPVIAIKNPFIEYYFSKMGNIGFLCDNYDEIKNIVMEILETNSNKCYTNQVNNLYKGRGDLSLEKISKKMRKIWEI